MSAENGKKKSYRKTVRTLKVDIEQDDGQMVEYTLKGLDGPSMKEWDDFKLLWMDENDKPKPGAGLAMFGKMISLTLFDPAGLPMSEADALALPFESQVGLFQDACELSGLNRLAKEMAKNA